MVRVDDREAILGGDEREPIRQRKPSLERDDSRLPSVEDRVVPALALISVDGGSGGSGSGWSDERRENVVCLGRSD